METKNGIPISNDDLGKQCYEAMDRIYVANKLWHDHITREDVESIIGCWEKFLTTLDPEDLKAIDIMKNYGDFSGLMGDAE